MKRIIYKDVPGMVGWISVLDDGENILLAFANIPENTEPDETEIPGYKTAIKIRIRDFIATANEEVAGLYKSYALFDDILNRLEEKIFDSNASKQTTTDDEDD